MGSPSGLAAGIGWLLPGTSGNQVEPRSKSAGIAPLQSGDSNPASGWRRIVGYSDSATFRIFRIPWLRMSCCNPDPISVQTRNAGKPYLTGFQLEYKIV